MTIASPEPKRCAEVIALDGGGALVSYASGYRISNDLVLTAAHACPDAAQVRVRLGGTYTTTADLQWRSGTADLALLRIPSSILAAVRPIRVGILPEGSGQVPFRMIGYPRLATRGTPGDELRDTWQVDGTLQLGSNLKSGLLGLSVDSAQPAEALAQPADTSHGADPWRGLSGAAVFARTGGELVGVAVRRLIAAGTGSIDAQPVADVADPAFRRILESADVIWQELEDSPHAALPPILSHRETLARLSGFRSYLTGERLGFVSPGAEHPSEPKAIFARLSGSDPEHVLLTGRPGSGKTRTCFEVARIAEESGWRAFHVQHYEPLASNKDLAEAIFKDTATPALIIIDTLSECQGLDLDGLRTRVTVEAQHLKATFALLATARPGQYRIMSRSSEFKTNIKALFRRIEMRHDKAHTKAVRNAILERAAPNAIARYGRAAVARACGERSIFALLIGADIERMIDAVRKPLELPSAEHPDLLDWLRRRLDEDRLAPIEPPRLDLFAEPAPTPELLACTALAAACPLPRDDLTSVAEVALTGAGSDPAKASRILDRLLSMGWLEQDGKRLTIVHDLVTDVLLQRVLMPDDDVPIADNVLNSILDACLTGTRAFGRFTATLGRVLRDTRDSEVERLHARCANWLTEHAEDVATLLSRAPARESGQAVATLLGGPPWTEVAIERWDTLIGPWLNRHRYHREARHLLYMSLSRMPDRVGAPLVATALRWLGVHGARIEAHFIIQALSRWSLDERQRDAVRQHTLRWLDAHAEAAEARWLLTSLLRRGQTRQTPPPAELEMYGGAARRWLARHGKNIDAFMLIASCLDSRQPELSRQAASSASAWLARHSAVPDAATVLVPLLRKTPHFTPELRAQTLRWLDRHAKTYRGSNVIIALLGRDHILDANSRSVAVRKAVEWLDTYLADSPVRTRPLLNVMLIREDPDVAVRVITLAMTWVEQHGRSPDTHHVLKRLLRRKDLPDRVRRIGAERTLQFVRNNSAEMDLSALLSPLLKDPDPSVRAKARIESLNCMDRYGDTPDACYMLQSLLRDPELDAQQSAKVTSKASAWLHSHPKEPRGYMVLPALLDRPDLTRELRETAGKAGLAWLARFGAKEEAAFVLVRLLDVGDLEADDRATVEDLASRWIRKHRRSQWSARVAVARQRSKKKAAAITDGSKRGTQSVRRLRPRTSESARDR